MIENVETESLGSEPDKNVQGICKATDQLTLRIE